MLATAATCAFWSLEVIRSLGFRGPQTSDGPHCLLFVLLVV